MASGGCGDVLTGIVAALAAGGLSAFNAACLAVYVHGLAGDYAAKEKGQISVIASDILRYLPRAFKTMHP
jgi:NAD(P)H-hydrate epimerase